jgi:hypothetical protein
VHIHMCTFCELLSVYLLCNFQGYVLVNCKFNVAVVSKCFCVIASFSASHCQRLSFVILIDVNVTVDN